jgi:cytochrome b6-f complex iron-sulfur subunit
MLKLSLAASGVLAAGGLVEYLQYSEGAAVPSTFELARPETYAMGSATHLAQPGAWLLRDARGLYALSTRCPHLGCTVQRQLDGFTCPCHGSQFALDGQLRRGPATRPLAYFKLTRGSDGRLVLHADETSAPADRLSI